MKKSTGRPPKRPEAKKQKVTLSLNPEIYKAAQKLCFDEGVSLSEKIDRLFATLAGKAGDLAKSLKESGEADLQKAADLKKKGKQ